MIILRFILFKFINQMFNITILENICLQIYTTYTFISNQIIITNLKLFIFNHIQICIMIILKNISNLNYPNIIFKKIQFRWFER